MIYDYHCPFCNKLVDDNHFVETRGHIKRDGGKTTKRQYFHEECFYENIIGAIRRKLHDK